MVSEKKNSLCFQNFAFYILIQQKKNDGNLPFSIIFLRRFFFFVQRVWNSFKFGKLEKKVQFKQKKIFHESWNIAYAHFQRENHG